MKEFLNEIVSIFAPPPTLTISEWADRYRMLSPEAAAEPGKWYTARAEYQRGIMDAITDPDIEIVVVMSSAQVGKTEIILNAIGYFISQDPSPILMVQPTVEMAQTFSKDRFSPMLRDTLILRNIIKAPKTRESGNTILHKTFPGGHITMSGANSPASLASRPIRVVLLDEVDRYPPSAGSEGDPVNLAIKRSLTFWNRIIVMTSTPTVKGFSRIEAAYEASDQRQYFVPCPDCGEFQTLKWGNVVWDKDENNNHLPETAKYACEKCGTLWDDAQRWAAISQGEWRATAEPKDKAMAGFHLNEIYSPWVRLEQIVTNFLKAKESVEQLKTFVNTSLGETWEDEGEKVDQTGLYSRREKYPAEVPAGGLVLTAGVDVQDDRLECEVVAWGKGEESWSIDFRIFYGNPGQADIWNDLNDFLSKTFQHESGINVKISCTGIDSGGHFTDQVYKFCKGKDAQRIYALKGSSVPGKPLISRPSKNNKYRVKLFSVGTDTAKEIIFARLKMEEEGAGYMHFPLKYDEEYFNQLTAEKITTKYVRGFPQRVWVKIRERNEALDCRVYAMAALAILNPNFEKIEESFKKINKEIENIKPKHPKRKRANSWVNSWKS